MIDFRAINPLGLSSTVEKIKPLESYLSSLPEIDFYIRKVELLWVKPDKPASEGEIVFKLKKERTKSVFELRDEISKKAEELVPNFEFDLFQILPDRLNDLSGSGKPIAITLRGDERQIEMTGEALKDDLEKIKGLDSVRIEEREKTDEINYTIDEVRARALDLNPNAITSHARFGVFSIDSTSIQVGPQTIPVLIKMDDRARTAALENVPLYTSKGGLEKLGNLGRASVVKNRTDANHIDGIPVRTVTAELSGRDLGSVVLEIKEAIRKNTSPGVYAEFAGDYKQQQTSFQELIYAFVTGIALIFLTSLFFSNSLLVALILTISALVPPAIGFAGCVLLHIALDVSSFSGLISVTGITVANSFMALSAIEAEFHVKKQKIPSIIDGMKSRLRPIMMTNLAAMGGFVPIAMGLSQGDEILRPFSIAIMIGLVGALLTTLVIMPSLYLLAMRPSRSSVES